MLSLFFISILFCPYFYQEKTVEPAYTDISFSVMFWNLENFFDWKDSGLSDSDREFSSSGDRRWTKSRFYTKCNAVAKAIMWIGDRYGRMPDIIGLAEVENSFVVRSLVGSTGLRKYGYEAVHYESADPRGIDVALIYRKDRFRCTGSRPHKIYGKDGKILQTRDILEVQLEGSEKGIPGLVVLVNHHPSKYGGEKVSVTGRMSAMMTLATLSDSLQNAGYVNIVAIGDFNDTPDSRAASCLEGILLDKSGGLFKSGKGTVRYKGKWEMIDLMFVSAALDSCSHMDICHIPFLLEEDTSAPGKKPFRTYSGPRYNGGASDHLPVIGIFY